jgi:hypothetical protein
MLEVGSYLAESGNLDNVQIYSVPPVPTSVAPGFEASYAGVVCSKQVEITLKNVSTTTFKSITISVNDTVADVTLGISSNEFANNDGCLPAVSVSKLDPGDTFKSVPPLFPRTQQVTS